MTIPNEAHQYLIDQLTALCLLGHITKEEAMRVIESVQGQPSSVDEAVLIQLRKDYGLPGEA